MPTTRPTPAPRATHHAPRHELPAALHVATADEQRAAAARLDAELLTRLSPPSV